MSQQTSDKKSLNPSARAFHFNPNAMTFAPPPPPPPPAPPVPSESLVEQPAFVNPPMPLPKKSGPVIALGETPATVAAKHAPPAAEASVHDTNDANEEEVTKKIEKIDIKEIPEKEVQEKEVHEDSHHDEVSHGKETEFVEEEDVGDEDPREHLNVVLIGHVDAGKSTLSGNILYLMGMVDKRTIERYEKEAKARSRESWFLSFIMDTGEEEREKGKTIEVGRAHFETENRRYTILDAPGHKTYVPNMIQGASQADIGILVISARKGEFETGFERGGQTREHALLAKTLGINKLVVVINKMDEADWAQERFDECVTKLRPFLRSCGFAVKRDLSFVPLSGLLGHNVKVRVDKKMAPWYEGDSLIAHLDTMHILGRDALAPLRVPILDRYQERGTVAMGKVESGILKSGHKILLMPTHTTVVVNQVYINDQPIRTAKPGENVTLRLSCGLDDIHKGFVLCNHDTKEGGPKAITSFVAQVALVDTLEHRPLLTAGYKCVLHIHTITQECCVVKLLRPIDPKTGKPSKKSVPFIRQGQSVICRIEVEQSICIETYERMPQLGRLTLRDEGKTIAIGKVLTLGEKKS